MQSVMTLPKGRTKIKIVISNLCNELDLLLHVHAFMLFVCVNIMLFML